MTADELVVRAMRRLGIDPDDKGANRALARQLKLIPHDETRGAQNVARWRSGYKPEYETTMMLLEAAGLLRKAARPLSASENGDDAGAELLLRLAEAVERIEAALDGQQGAQGE